MKSLNFVSSNKLNKFQAKYIPEIGVLRCINLWQNHKDSLEGSNAEMMGVWDALEFMGFPTGCIAAKLVNLHKKGYIEPLVSWRYCMLTDKGLDRLQQLEDKKRAEAF
jgi:hypothetical protein